MMNDLTSLLLVFKRFGQKNLDIQAFNFPLVPYFSFLKTSQLELAVVDSYYFNAVFA